MKIKNNWTLISSLQAKYKYSYLKKVPSRIIKNMVALLLFKKLY